MADKIINAALCSYGMSGLVFHAPFIDIHPGFHLYACWERSKDLIGKDYDGVKTFRSFDKMLEDDNIDMVVVNTPSATHYEYAKLALEAGKDIVVEKPFTSTSAEGQDLVDLAKQKGLKISVFQNRRYDSDFRTVKNIVDQGILGTIMEAEIHYDRYKLELSPKAHKETPGPGVGVLFDLGSHVIDQGLQLFGMPNKLFADIGSMRPGSKVPDYFEILMKYNNGLRVRLKSSYVTKKPFPSFVIHGTEGTFMKSRADVQEDDLKAKKALASDDWGRETVEESGMLTAGDNEQLVHTLRGNYLDYYDEVYNAFTDQGKIPVTGEEGRNVIKIIELAYQSDEEERVINL